MRLHGFCGGRTRVAVIAFGPVELKVGVRQAFLDCRRAQRSVVATHGRHSLDLGTGGEYQYHFIGCALDMAWRLVLEYPLVEGSVVLRNSAQRLVQSRSACARRLRSSS